MVLQVRSHRDLIVWQKAMDLAEATFRLTEDFPKSQLYGLTSQLTRAVSSVPANIAEGGARDSAADYSRFLAIAKGSLMEADTFLLLAVRLGYVTDKQTAGLHSLVTEVAKMLSAIRSKLKSGT